MMWQSVAVFCGSKTGNNNLFVQHARETGLLIARRGITLIYGGGKNGLMGVVADTVLQQGGTVVGVIPEMLNEKEHQHETLTALHIVEDMHARKKLMYELSDAAIILPGGYGTMDELFEMITWNQLNIHDKKIVLLNSDGYYDHLIAHIQMMEKENFLYGHPDEKMTVLKEPSDLLNYL